MTAIPEPSDFVARRAPFLGNVNTRPNVTDHFWGYEVRTNKYVIDAAVMTRLVCGILTVVMFGAAVGVWLMPEFAVTGPSIVAKVILTILLVLGSLFLGLSTAQGTRVRLQIDTARRELREVVSGPMGEMVTLATYRMDAVERIEVMASAADCSVGQVQITLRGLGTIPAGDGAMSALHGLRNRLADDCGVYQHDTSPVSVLGEPLAA